jgi:transcriptional regulator with XRE-family HTH domain
MTNELSQIIKKQREILGISQVDLANKSNVGVATIQNIEAKKANPELSTIVRILNTLGLTLTIEKKSASWEQLIDFGVPLLGRISRKDLKLAETDLVDLVNTIDWTKFKSIKDDRALAAVGSFFSAVDSHFPTTFAKFEAGFKAYALISLIQLSTPKLRRIALSSLSNYL